MISSIVLTGILKDPYKGVYRYVETHNNDVLNPEQEIISLIPLKYWTRDAKNPLFHAPNGTKVVIRGHIESDKEIGLHIVVETLEM
ncbi:MAG: hypothetical protein K6F07_00855 [Bacilli bacterium]|nr:hypothetical protein [Bacilli bacterium]